MAVSAPVTERVNPLEIQSVVRTRKGLPDRWTDVASGAGAALVSSLIAAWVLQLWRASSNRPLVYMGDAFAYTAMIKGTIDNGWYVANPDLGAPLGFQSHEFPLFSNDSLHFLIIKVIGFFSDSPFVVLNAFFMLTFALCSLTAYWAMRRLGASVGSAFACSVLYSVLPYHFLRGESHLFFSSYYTVPLGAVLILGVLADEPMFRRRDHGHWLVRWATPATLITSLLCAAVAAGGIYYAAFTTLLLVAAIGARFLVTLNWRAVLPGIVILGALVTVVVVLQLPNVLHHREDGGNPIVARRQPAESEFYALKLDQMVLPIGGHRLGPLSNLAEKYESTTPLPSEPTGNLGLIGSIGLAWLLIVGVGATIEGRHRLGTERERHTSFTALVAFILATVGGLSAVLAYTITPQLRSWSRMSVVIAFFAMLAVALVLDRVRVRLTKAIGRPAFVALLCAVIVVGALDQTSRRYIPDYDGIRAAYRNVDNFVRTIEGELPDGSAVLQLPYAAFPENGPTNRMLDYDHLRAYLSSDRLRWSYGAVKGSDQDWQGAFADAPLTTLLDAAAAANFSAVWVDRFAYADNGAALEQTLADLLGPALSTSDDDRLTVWDLRDYGSARQGKLTSETLRAMREAALQPVQALYVDGFYNSEGSGESRWRWAEDHATIDLDNTGSEAQAMLFDVEFRTDVDATGSVQLRFPDGTSRRVSFGLDGTRIRHSFRVPPGNSRIDLEADAPRVPGDPRELVVQVRNAVLVPEAVCVAESVAECTSGPRPQIP